MMTVLAKGIHRFKAISIKIPMVFFLQKWKKIILKFISNFKGLRMAKTISEKN